MEKRRNIFFISDGTGITAEALGHSLLTQFESMTFETKTIPYVNTPEKAQQIVDSINHIHCQQEQKPIVFATLVNPKIRAIFEEHCKARFLEFFHPFLHPLEEELGTHSSYTIGKSHSIDNTESYKQRIEAVNFALNHDDGLATSHYHQADVIIIGVSRCGKTPSSLYLALQFGLLTANYPFTSDDLYHTMPLPKCLKPYKNKLFGLTIEPERLHTIRQERRPNSQYASLAQCQREVQQVEDMYQHEGISFLNTTTSSVEEIATKILEKTGLKRKTY